jgi:hypothetical protein
MEELGNVEESELNSSAEARKLAFYLFWCALQTLRQPQSTGPRHHTGAVTCCCICHELRVAALRLQSASHKQPSILCFCPSLAPS